MGKRARSHLAWTCGLWFGCCLGLSQPVVSATIVDFEDVALSANSALPATASDQSPLSSRGVSFNRTWNTEFDCCASGWAVSNQRNQTAPGPASAFSAYVQAAGGGGHASSNFAVGNNLMRGESQIDFPEPVAVQGMYLANVTYTYLAVAEGNDGAGFVSGPFGPGDWLKLEVIGLDSRAQELGRVPAFLADFRDGKSQLLQEWTWLDLGPLGNNIQRLEFEMSSTDTGPFGMNTPAYFAIDDLTYEQVPEPAGLGASAGLLFLIAARGRRLSS